MSKQSLNSTVKIRSFTTADMAVLAGWFTSRREVVQWGGASLDYPLVSTVMRSWLAEADQVLPVCQCWTALRQIASKRTRDLAPADTAGGNDEVVGHAQVVFDRRNAAGTLCRVGIAPSARGLGIGPAMLVPIIADAFQNHGMQRLELAVYPSNTPAIRLYRRPGFALEQIASEWTRDSALSYCFLDSDWGEGPHKPVKTDSVLTEFALEGTRHSAVIVDGERWDVQIMGLLQDQWEHHRGGHSINS